jgi:CDP-glycerol glycerophosphotransferase (TagB/SpsB family)
MINIFSTISLEAAICDLPVIHMGYDIYDYGTQYRIMTEFQQRQTHNKDKLRLAAARVAKSEDELMSFLRMYLDDKSIDKDNRYEYALSECEWFDGKASERLVKIIHNSVDES